MKRIILIFTFCILASFSFAQQNNFYKRYYGSIDKYPIVMDIIAVDTSCYGWYYYEKQGIPIRIEGTRKNAKLVFDERNEKGDVTGTFTGTVNANGGMTGSWKKPSGASLSFDLREDYSHGSMKLRPEVVTEEYEAGPDYGFSFSTMFLVPEGNADKTVETAIVEKIYDVKVKGRSYADAVKNELRLQLDSSLADYKSTLQEALADTSEGFYHYMYNWDEQSNAEVVFNERNILCLAVNAYLYSGGAHGNYGTSNFVFNTKTGNEVRLKDIFLRGYRDKLPQLLEQQFRKVNEVPVGQSLMDFGLFVDKIEPTEENFFITRNGIGFTYVPYEIGPYAAGQIEVVLPYSMISDLLDPDGIAGWAIKKQK